MSVSDSPDNEEYDSSEEDYDSSEWAVNAYGGRLNVKPAAPHIPPAAPGPSTKDYLWGAAMALCVALVPNTLSLLVTLNPSPLSGADKLFVVSLLAFGAASVSLLTFGSKAVGARDSRKLTAYG